MDGSYTARRDFFPMLACLLKGWEVLGCDETGRGAEEDWGLPVLGMSVEDRWAFHTTGRKNTFLRWTEQQVAATLTIKIGRAHV